jgi:hypothetical protein
MDRLLNQLAFVGQPILAAAAFQAALSRHARVFAPGERCPKAGGSYEGWRLMESAWERHKVFRIHFVTKY